MAEIIVLANSKKLGNRCIAGIDRSTNKWVRPCYDEGEEGIPREIRQIHGSEPEILDILSIPLELTGPNRDIQPENRYLKDGAWSQVGRARIRDIEKYCIRRSTLFYNTKDCVPVAYLRGLSSGNKESLTMIKAQAVFSTGASPRGNRQVRAAFKCGFQNYDLSVTDCEFTSGIKPYSRPIVIDCIMTISLGAPYNDNCYKLVAGVIKI